MTKHIINRENCERKQSKMIHSNMTIVLISVNRLISLPGTVSLNLEVRGGGGGGESVRNKWVCRGPAKNVGSVNADGPC